MVTLIAPTRSTPLTRCGGCRKHHPRQHGQRGQARRSWRPGDLDEGFYPSPSKMVARKSREKRTRTFVPSTSSQIRFSRDKRHVAPEYQSRRAAAGKRNGTVEAILARCRVPVACPEGRRPRGYHVGTIGAESPAGVQFGSRLALKPWR